VASVPVATSFAEELVDASEKAGQGSGSLPALSTPFSSALPVDNSALDRLASGKDIDMSDWPTAPTWSGPASEFPTAFPACEGLGSMSAADAGGFEFSDTAAPAALPDAANHAWAPFPASNDTVWPPVVDSWPPADPSMSDKTGPAVAREAAVTKESAGQGAFQFGPDSWPQSAAPSASEQAWVSAQAAAETWPQLDANWTSAAPAAPTMGHETPSVSVPRPSDASTAPMAEVDEVTRHLLSARSKIEAVEQEFAHIMEELTAYGKRLPASSKALGFAEATGSPMSASASRDPKPEYFFINTPSAGARPEEGSSFLWSSVGEGRRLIDSLGEGGGTAVA